MASSVRGHTPAPRRVVVAGPPYMPPAAVDVRNLHVGDLLTNWRPMTEQQQERFGFSAASPGAPVWCTGDLGLINRPCVAVVGTRKVSTQGAERARFLSRKLVDAGVVVVSGLAMGVDTEALDEALERGGRVIAVIGTPIDDASPSQNRRMQERIYREHLLVSQFAPGSTVQKSNFPARNKLMAAMTDATAIIEADDDSGTLHQAGECVRLGRWLFIAESLFKDPNVHWPARFRSYNRMVILTSVQQVLDVLPRLPSL